jgi:malonyl CoA-acyl carrier protein transacylase
VFVVVQVRLLFQLVPAQQPCSGKRSDPEARAYSDRGTRVVAHLLASAAGHSAGLLTGESRNATALLTEARRNLAGLLT